MNDRLAVFRFCLMAVVEKPSLAWRREDVKTEAMLSISIFGKV
jgi:hypothetical protein